MNFSINIVRNSFLVLIVSAVGADSLAAQSTFDLEPPVQASVESSQAIMSPDPDALPVFRFATAELDKEGNVTIATKQSTQTLIAPMPGAVSADLDPSGIRYTENVTQNYTVTIPYTEKDEDGNVTTKMRTETRTRTVPVTRHRKRNAEEQAEFEKRVAEEKEKRKSSDEPEIKPAIANQVEQKYTVNVQFVEEEDGEKVVKTGTQTRTRMVTVYRGKSETKSTLDTNSWPVEKLKCYDIDGVELDVETIKHRLTERQPVILVTSAEGITPFFKSLLNPEATFIVTPKKKTKKD